MRRESRRNRGPGGHPAARVTVDVTQAECRASVARTEAGAAAVR